jgi:hypothetical protein
VCRGAVKKSRAIATIAAINERSVSPSRMPERVTSWWRNGVGCIRWLPAMAVKNGYYTALDAADLPQEETT